MTQRDVRFGSDAVELAGTVWLPDREPRGGLVMVGGSGPSDRDNDVLFTPIRRHFLANGIAVLSYDKRGVGASSGSWVAATIDEFALDAAAAYDVLRKEVETVGVFGHSEGGWVVLRAAASCSELAFVVTNSTPGITPVEQDRHSVDVALRAAGEAEEVVQSALALYDQLVAEMRRGASWADVQPLLLAEPALTPYFGELDEDAWRSALPKLDHDPELDVVGLSCPHLALFGSADELVPVPPSVAAFAAAAARRLSGAAPMTIEIFPGANHRLGIGPGFAPGYLQTLTDWILRRVR